MFARMKKAARNWRLTSPVCSLLHILEKQFMLLSATNIEHFIERTAAFVVIVLGELVLSVVYHASGAQIGFKR